MLPFISVVVPTCNRNEVLTNTLKGLLAQDYPHYEIIVVDQSTVSYSLKERSSKEIHQKIKYIYSSLPSRPNAKNIGIANARGEVVFFCDDDIIPAKNLLSLHAQHYQNPKIGGVAGAVLSIDEKRLRALNVGKINRWGMGSGNFNSLESTFVDTVHGANMSFRKNILVKMGGFDTRFSGTSMFEESDLSFRIRKRGWQIIFEPAATVIHLPQTHGNIDLKKRIPEYWYAHFFHNLMIFSLKNFKENLPFVFIFTLASLSKKLVSGEITFRGYFKIMAYFLKGYETLTVMKPIWSIKP